MAWHSSFLHGIGTLGSSEQDGGMLTVLSGAAAAGVTPAESGAFIPNISALWHA